MRNEFLIPPRASARRWRARVGVNSARAGCRGGQRSKRGGGFPRRSAGAPACRRSRTTRPRRGRAGRRKARPPRPGATLRRRRVSAHGASHCPARRSRRDGGRGRGRRWHVSRAAARMRINRLGECFGLNHARYEPNRFPSSSTTEPSGRTVTLTTYSSVWIASSKSRSPSKNSCIRVIVNSTISH